MQLLSHPDPRPSLLPASILHQHNHSLIKHILHSVERRLLIFLPSDNGSHMIWSDINRISLSTPVFSLLSFYQSEVAHIPLSLPEVSTLQLPPLADLRNTQLLVNSPPTRHWWGYSVYFPPSPGSLSVPQSKLIPIHSACCLLYTSPSPRDQRGSRMPSSA